MQPRIDTTRISPGAYKTGEPVAQHIGRDVGLLGDAQPLLPAAYDATGISRHRATISLNSCQSAFLTPSVTCLVIAR